MTALTKPEPNVVTFAPVDPMVSMIERVVLDPSADMAKLEKLLDMKERMERAGAERAFAAAFAAASAEFPPIPLNGKGNNNKPYALLKDIIGLTRPVLSRHGLALSFDVHTEGKVRVTARLSHQGGHVQTTTIDLPADKSGSKNEVQAVGSSQTYGQRYAAQAILGLSLGDDVDDDGAGAGLGSTITADQFRALRGLMEQAGGDEGKFLGFFKIEHLEELPLARFGEADAMLRKKIAAKAGS